MNVDQSKLTQVPKILEEYFFCRNEQLCSGVTEAFELKRYAIKKMTYPKLIKKLCKKIQELKAQSKTEINYWIEKIKEIELKESLKHEEHQKKAENNQIGEKEIIQQLENDLAKHKEKVKRLKFGKKKKKLFLLRLFLWRERRSIS